VLTPKGITINSVANMFTLFFTPNEVRNFDDVKACDTERFGLFFRHMLRHGIYFSPSQFETCFVSLAHTEEQLQHVIEVASKFEE
jgi:glutamate-1-semialdehyde 2,1-aminomutase